MIGAAVLIVAMMTAPTAPVTADGMTDGTGARPTAAHASTGRYEACRYDDGSGSGRRPCIWDGRHLGNGVGRSYLAIPVYPFRGTDPVIRYMPHRRAHVLLFGGAA